MEGFDLDLIIITGMSGAGKSQAADALEDIGYYCIDNIPPVLIEAIVDLGSRGQKGLSKIAVITDLRGGEMFNEIEKTINSLKEKNIHPKVLFLDASDTELARRYRENRRIHPLSAANNIEVSEAIMLERENLLSIKARADYVIDTTFLSTRQLKQQILDIFLKDSKKSMKIQCISFGNKFGYFYDADLVFDVRCLPNPFYEESLKNLTGKDREVRDYIMEQEQSKEFVKRLLSLIEYSVPLYIKEGKSRLVIAIGCTGGKHRSVTVAMLIYDMLKSLGYDVSIAHRDIEK